MPRCNTSRPCRRRRSRRKSVRCRVFDRQQRRRPVAVGDDEARVRAERARAIGLFRYQLIREAADPAHSTKERGKMVRELASREHTDPFGRRVRISRQTIDRWIRDWVLALGVCAPRRWDRANRPNAAGADPAVAPVSPSRSDGEGGGGGVLEWWTRTPPALPIWSRPVPTRTTSASSPNRATPSAGNPARCWTAGGAWRRRSPAAPATSPWTR